MVDGDASGEGGDQPVGDDPADLQNVWQQVVADLSSSLTSHQRAWLSITDLVGMIGTTALLAAPSGFARDTIERTLREPITAALSDRMQLPITLAVTVSESAAAAGEVELGRPPENRESIASANGVGTPHLHGGAQSRDDDDDDVDEEADALAT